MHNFHYFLIIPPKILLLRLPGAERRDADPGRNAHDVGGSIDNQPTSCGDCGGAGERDDEIPPADRTALCRKNPTRLSFSLTLHFLGP